MRSILKRPAAPGALNPCRMMATMALLAENGWSCGGNLCFFTELKECYMCRNWRRLRTGAVVIMSLLCFPVRPSFKLRVERPGWSSESSMSKGFHLGSGARVLICRVCPSIQNPNYAKESHVSMQPLGKIPAAALETACIMMLSPAGAVTIFFV